MDNNNNNNNQPQYYYGEQMIASAAPIMEDEIDYLASSGFESNLDRMNNHSDYMFEEDAEYSMGRFQFQDSPDSHHPDPLLNDRDFDQQSQHQSIACSYVPYEAHSTQLTADADANSASDEQQQQYSSNMGAQPEQGQFQYDQIQSFAISQNQQQQFQVQQQQQAPIVPRMNVKEKALQRRKAIEKKQQIAPPPVLNKEEVEEAEELDKKKLQKIKNRISAQKSRDLKKFEFSDLRGQVQELKQQVETLQSEKEVLKNQLRSRSYCSRCRSDSSTACDTISDFSSEDAFLAASSSPVPAALSTQESSGTHSLASSSTSFEYIRNRQHSRGSTSYSSINVMIIIGIVLCVSMAPSMISDASNKNNFESIQETGGIVKNNFLMLNEMNRNSGNELCSCSCNSNSTSATRQQNGGMIERLVAMNGIDPSSLNYNTRIVDSRVNHRTNELAYYVTLDDDIEDKGNASTSCKQEQEENTALEPKQKNDQIYCSDPLIFLNNLSQEQKEGNKFIDLVYSTDQAKSFIQFGDQYFQTKADGTDKYVQLTCQVVNYYSRDI